MNHNQEWEEAPLQFTWKDPKFQITLAAELDRRDRPIKMTFWGEGSDELFQEYNEYCESPHQLANTIPSLHFQRMLYRINEDSEFQGMENDEIFCRCFSVPKKAVSTWFASHQYPLDSLLLDLNVGMGCGSCRKELLPLIEKNFASEILELGQIKDRSQFYQAKEKWSSGFSLNFKNMEEWGRVIKEELASLEVETIFLGSIYPYFYFEGPEQNAVEKLLLELDSSSRTLFL